MMLNQITAEAGAHKRRKRVGRGESSGHGRTSGHGNKGCQSRAGGGPRPLMEGGQMPIFRRLPKRGFNNAVFRTEYRVVNLASLEARCADGQRVDVQALRQLRLVSGMEPQIKILGKGTLSKKLTVQAHAFSAAARAAIEKAGGTVQVLERPDPAALARAKRNTKRSAKAKRAAQAPPAPEATGG